MSQVLLGWDETLRREVAIKILRQRNRQHDATRSEAAAVNPADSLIIQEARTLAKLKIDGVAHVYDCDTKLVDRGNTTVELDFMVYQKIDGVTLDQWCETRRQQRDWRSLASQFFQIAEVLQRVHSQQVYHRDIKPANILVTGDNQPVLIDFGLAMLSSGSGASGLGPVCGTLRYMSPEQTLGKPQQLDGRSDLFSLGVTFYQMLCGRLPFDAPSGKWDEIFESIRTQRPQPLRQVEPSIPAALAQIVLRLLEKEPTNRYPTAADLSVALKSFLQPLGGSSLGSEWSQERFLAVVQSRDAQWADTEVALATAHFSEAEIGVTSHEAHPIKSVDPQMNSDGKLWEPLLRATLEALNRSRSNRQPLHLVARINTLCAFALGLQMNNQFDCWLYHCQQSRLYRLWRIDRAVKDGRSPRANDEPSPSFFALENEANAGEADAGSSSNPDRPGSAAALIFEVGANSLLAEVTRWRDRVQTKLPIRRYTKNRRTLDPNDAASWIAAAIEVSRAIKEQSENELYQFLDMPAALALMAGDALGNWSGKQLHLMQYADQPRKVGELPYREIRIETE
jgi:serine/threonine protein kinase